MPPGIFLMCNFTLQSSLNLAVSYQSDQDGNYGGQITISSPTTAYPITTGLWDNDGNVFFTIYDSQNPSLSCIINSASVPGSWEPYVEVGTESGLTCVMTGPQQTGEGIYAYTLTITPTA